MELRGIGLLILLPFSGALLAATGGGSRPGREGKGATRQPREAGSEIRGQEARSENPEVGQVRVAMCQTLCVDSDREGNFRRIEEALSRAVASKAQIVCFPETAILGWVNPDAHAMACPIPGKDSDRLAELARRHGVMLCVGMAEKDGERLYDSVVLIDRTGRLAHKHRKINILTELMTPPYTPGQSIEAVETEFGRIGLLVCADTFSAGNLERMRDCKPDLVLVPYGWAAEPSAWPGHGESLRKTVAKAARTIGAPVIGTDLVGTITHGPWTGRTYGGQSIAICPDGRILATGKDREPDVVVFDASVGWSDPRAPGRRGTEGMKGTKGTE